MRPVPDEFIKAIIEEIRAGSKSSEAIKKSGISHSYFYFRARKLGWTRKYNRVNLHPKAGLCRLDQDMMSVYVKRILHAKNKAALCRELNLPYSTYYWYRKKFCFSILEK